MEDIKESNAFLCLTLTKNGKQSNISMVPYNTHLEIFFLFIPDSTEGSLSVSCLKQLYRSPESSICSLMFAGTLKDAEF